MIKKYFLLASALCASFLAQTTYATAPIYECPDPSRITIMNDHFVSKNLFVWLAPKIEPALFSAMGVGSESTFPLTKIHPLDNGWICLYGANVDVAKIKKPYTHEQLAKAIKRESNDSYKGGFLVYFTP